MRGMKSPPPDVDRLIIFKEVVRLLLNMCLRGVCFVILTEPQTNQI